MKKQIIFWKLVGCLCLLWTAHANAQNHPQNVYQINGTFNGLQSGLIKMISVDGRKVADSAEIVDGKFALKGKIELPEQRIFQITPGIWAFPAFVEPGNLTFTIDTSGAQRSGEMGKGGHALIWKIQENGSTMADAYNNYADASKMTEMRTLVFSLRDSLREMQGNESAQNDVQMKIDSLINTTLSKQKLFLEQYVNANPRSVAGVFLLTDYFRNSEDEHESSAGFLQETLEKFSGQAKQSVYYQRLIQKRDELKNISTNATAPDFTIPMRDSTRFTLSSLKGSYVLLDFWASWCGPCRAAIPHWKEVNKKYHAKGLKMVSISTDANRKKWEKALDKEQMPWIQVVDNPNSKDGKGGHVRDLYYSRSIPFYVLIDKAGKVVISTDDEAIMTNKITQIMK